MPSDEYVLTLTKEEFMVIRALIGKTTGPDSGARGYANTIWDAIRFGPNDFDSLLVVWPEFW